MSGRVRVTLADGRKVIGFRKTLARRAPRTPPHLQPDWRMTILLPLVLSLVSPGPSSVVGVSIEPDQISGPLAVATGKNLDWVYRQMARYLLAIARGIERELTASVMRASTPPIRREQVVILRPRMVEYPRKGRPPLRIAA